MIEGMSIPFPDQFVSIWVKMAKSISSNNYIGIIESD